jgi:di/tricarboxylate transporter
MLRPTRKNIMKGALVFLAFFLVFLLATLAYPDLPPGRQIYGALNVQETDYLVLGVPATTLIIAVLNGVVYGIIAWLIYTITQGLRKKK